MPDGRQDEALEAWDRVASFMECQDGFVSGRWPQTSWRDHDDTGRLAREDRSMADEARTLTLRFEVGTELAGTIAGGGEEIGFTGWIELASLIDRLRPRTLEGGCDAALTTPPHRHSEPPVAPAGS